jgi:uncharacterized protein
MAGKFEVKTAANGQFMFNLKAGNGQVILTSEMYQAEDSCMNGIESVKKNSADDGRFDRKTSSNGKPFFSLTATNGQIIGKSEMYESEAARENGIESVKKNAPEAAIVKAAE